MLKREAIVKHIQGVTFAGKADTGHWVMMDGPARLGGSDAGARPKGTRADRPGRLHGERRG